MKEADRTELDADLVEATRRMAAAGTPWMTGEEALALVESERMDVVSKDAKSRKGARDEAAKARNALLMREVAELRAERKAAMDQQVAETVARARALLEERKAAARAAK